MRSVIRPVQRPDSIEGLLVIDIPERYQERRLEGFDPASVSTTKALAAAWRVVNGEIKSLVLVGPPGVGKTHLAAGICWEAYRRVCETWMERTKDGPPTHAITYTPEGAEVRRELPPWERHLPALAKPPEWVNVPQLIVDLRAEMGTDEDSSAAWVRELRAFPGLVVLDDIGREKVSDWTSELIYTLVNGRYESVLRTIATTNLTSAELQASGYWPAISRLAEDGELVRIEAPDFRLRKRVAA